MGRIQRLSHGWFWTVMLVAGAGCKAGLEVTGREATTEKGTLASLGTPSALAALSNVDAYSQPDPAMGPQLSAVEAVALATAVARAASGIPNSLKKERGGAPVDFAALIQCGHVYYAHSLYVLPPSTVSQFEKNRHGPQWLVGFCARGEPQLSVSVAAFATYLHLSPRGVIQYPPVAGGEFVISGIPKDWEGVLPVLPETAASLAAVKTGRQFINAPDLIAPPPRWVPQAAQWRVSLSNRTGENAGLSTGSNDVFVGLRLDGTNAVGLEAVQVQTLVDDGAEGVRAPIALGRGIVWHPKSRFVAVKGGN